MAWHQTGAKPLSEPMMASFTEAYESLNLNELIRVKFESLNILF